MGLFLCHSEAAAGGGLDELLIQRVVCCPERLAVKTVRGDQSVADLIVSGSQLLGVLLEHDGFDLILDRGDLGVQLLGFRLQGFMCLTFTAISVLLILYTPFVVFSSIFCPA